METLQYTLRLCCARFEEYKVGAWLCSECAGPDVVVIIIIKGKHDTSCTCEVKWFKV